MGSELVSDLLPPNINGVEESTPIVSYEQMFYKHLPYYLAIGMSNDEFWNGDCYLAKVYRQVDELNKRRKNEELWLQGLYFYEVLLDVAPRYDQLAKSQHRKPIDYPKEPYAITEKQIKEKKERDEKNKYEKMKARMKVIADSLNQKLRKGKEGE